MKRHWELVRRILLAVEALQSDSQVLTGRDVPGYDHTLTSYHIFMLKEAGLLVATCSNSLGEARECHVFELTWAGHEFLDKVRGQTLWSKTVGLLRVKGLELSFDTIKAASSAVALSMINL